MTLEAEKQLDETGWQILRELEANGRLSFAELGRRVGLSLPAVSERVRRMEDSGIIAGYEVRLDPSKLGRPISAFVRIRLLETLDRERLDRMLADLPPVLECHNVTGDDCVVLKIAVADIPELERTIQQLKSLGPTTTSIILSSFARKGLTGPGGTLGENGRPGRSTRRGAAAGGRAGLSGR